MGNYLFNNEVLIDALDADAANDASTHDFGRDILPTLIASHAVYAPTIFARTACRSRPKAKSRATGAISAPSTPTTTPAWISAPSIRRSIYTIAAWPLRTVGYADPPAKFVFDWNDRQGMAVNSIVAEGTIISGSHVHNCVVGRNVRVHSFSRIENSVIMDWVEIGRNCRIRNAIIDKANVIPSGTEIGYDAERGPRALHGLAQRDCGPWPRGPRKTTWVMTNP